MTSLAEGRRQITAVIDEGMIEWLDKQAHRNYFNSRSSYIAAVLGQHRERIETEGQDGVFKSAEE